MGWTEFWVGEEGLIRTPEDRLFYPIAGYPNGWESVLGTQTSIVTYVTGQMDREPQHKPKDTQMSSFIQGRLFFFVCSLT
jgi:hypothetical protein